LSFRRMMPSLLRLSDGQPFDQGYCGGFLAGNERAVTRPGRTVLFRDEMPPVV